MNKGRRISVVVTVHGIEAHIERSLRSLLEQTMTRGVEFVVVNDATRDRSMEIARRLAAGHSGLEVRFIEMERNGGVAAARMRGLAEARGEYVIFMDGDDLCEPAMLESMWRRARQTDADIVVCDFWMEFPRRTVLCPQRELTVGALVGTRTHGSMSNKLVRRSLYERWEIGFTPGLNMWEDLAVCVELFDRASKIVCLPTALFHYVQHRGSSLRNMSQSKLDSILEVTCRVEAVMRRGPMSRREEGDLATRKWFALHSLVRNTRGRAQDIYLGLWPELGARPGPIPVARLFVWALAQARQGRVVLANIVYRAVDLLTKL